MARKPNTAPAEEVAVPAAENTPVEIVALEFPDPMVPPNSALVADEPPAPVPDGFPLTLDEACASISMGDRRVELIAAFHHTERRAGRNRDTEAAYRARYAAFAKRPV